MVRRMNDTNARRLPPFQHLRTIVPRRSVSCKYPTAVLCAFLRFFVAIPFRGTSHLRNLRNLRMNLLYVPSRIISQ
jgi:hypothetical protein